MNSTLNFGIPIVSVFQVEVYYKADRLLISLTAQQKGATARWYSNKTSVSKKMDYFRFHSGKVSRIKFISEFVDFISENLHIM